MQPSCNGSTIHQASASKKDATMRLDLLVVPPGDRHRALLRLVSRLINERLLFQLEQQKFLIPCEYLVEQRLIRFIK